MDIAHLENYVEITFKTNEKRSSELIKVTFERQPFVMKKWTIYKIDGSKTEIMFNNLLLNNKIDLILFDIDREDPRPAIWKN